MTDAPATQPLVLTKLGAPDVQYNPAPGVAAGSLPALLRSQPHRRTGDRVTFHADFYTAGATPGQGCYAYFAESTDGSFAGLAPTEGSKAMLSDFPGAEFGNHSFSMVYEGNAPLVQLCIAIVAVNGIATDLGYNISALDAQPSRAFDPARKPIRTRFGANCYDLFYLPLMNGLASRDPLPRLQAMKDAGVAFVRFAASPYWPKEWASTWFTDQAAYLSVLDAVFAAAEKVGIGLVPSLIWAPFAISDHFGEGYAAWGEPASNARRFMDGYVPVIVNRYRRSRALLMWEFGNEMSDLADFPNIAGAPNGYQFWPPVSVEQGTPAARGTGDNITSAMTASAFAAFAALIRWTGDDHPISGGCGMIRHNQVNNATNHWTPDTADQFATLADQLLAGHLNALSAHLYEDALQDRFRTGGASYAELLTELRAVADAAGSLLFVGEFGTRLPSGDDAADRATVAAQMAAIKAARVDYAACWVFDKDNDPNNITPGNSRNWILGLIAAANGND